MILKYLLYMVVFHKTQFYDRSCLFCTSMIFVIFFINLHLFYLQMMLICSAEIVI